MILLIDNYDSFTYNLYQYFCEEDIDVKVTRNDQITIAEIEELSPEAIILSPGPKLPSQAGICLEIVKHFYKKIPILGICLGHQAIVEALGGKLRPAKRIMHGKTSLIQHNGKSVFQYLPQPLEVMRYHSYTMDEDSPLEDCEIIATSLEDDEVMAIKHNKYPVVGLQFHPESIGTVTGKHMILNFLRLIKEEKIK